MNVVLDKLKMIESKISNEILVVSDLTKLILANRLTKTELNMFLEKFVKIFYNKNRSIIFPSFISPTIKRDIINLDTEKSTTGILSEIFRNFRNVKRTQNPYFSYSILGKEDKTFTNINPLYEWSSKSHLGWMEKKNVSCIILGSYAANNPLIHRIEYKNKNLIKYREFKKFTNDIIFQNQKKAHTQFYFNMKKGYEYMDKQYMNLFNRSKKLEIDDLTINNFSIFHYRAKVLCDLCEKEIKNNKIFQVGIRLNN